MHSPSELIDISPSPPSIDNEPTVVSLSPSPPPPVVRIASPLRSQKTTETPRKKKHSQERNDETSTENIKKKKMKTHDIPKKHKSHEKSKKILVYINLIEFISLLLIVEDVKPTRTSTETDTRKLRTRRPNPKYSTEQFEMG